MQIEDAVVVVAHPDDEILWFSSILERCKSAIVCFGPSATSVESYDQGRAAVIENYPLDKVRFLKLTQSDANGEGHWKRPSDAGFRLRRPNVSYEANRVKLVSALASLLEGERFVFTHNPWGEYGHEEHVQVFDVLAALKAQLGYELRVSGYVGKRSLKTMLKSSCTLDGPPLIMKTDQKLAGELRQLYLQNNCWTWREDNNWPDFEVFYRFNDLAGRCSTTRETTEPLNFISYELDQSLPRRVAGKLLPPAVKARLKRSLNLN